MKSKALIIVILAMVVNVVLLNSQTPSKTQKQIVITEKPIVLAISSFEIIGAENFHTIDVNAMNENSSAVFTSLVNDYQIPGVKIVDINSDEILGNKTEYVDANALAEHGKLFNVDYLLQGTLISYSAGTLLLKIQIIDVKEGGIIASTSSVFREIYDLAKLTDILVATINVALNSQVHNRREKEEERNIDIDVEKYLVLSIHPLEVIGGEQFNASDINVINESLFAVFSSMLANNKIDGIKIRNNTNFNNNEVLNNGHYIDKNTLVEQGKLFRADYILIPRIQMLSSTLIFIAQIIDAESNTVIASINAGYKEASEIEELLSSMDNTMLELFDTFVENINNNNSKKIKK